MLNSKRIPRREFLVASAIAGTSLGLKGMPPSVANGNHCIFLSLTGGPSHLDTWDMKPDAPREIRGPYRPIKTNVPGIEISEIFPRLARHADKFAILRGVHHTETTHEAARALLPPTTPLPVLSLDRESPATRDLYGRNPFGEDCLRARLAIEAGAPFVSLEMFDAVSHRITWDMHGWKPYSPMNAYANTVGPMFDMAYSALLEDLSQRGLLKNTMVVAIGEFGRTPRINAAGGRDHWPECYSALLAGGPIQGGQVVGSSDATGSEPKDRPVTPEEIAATIYRGLGRTVPPGSAPIRELLA